ncbi:hypothetical protein FGO68_gene6348 [Halteria grandinella]|uniref:Uncharacterized protein n=1 Tax=Halteria grandinella TaxID=5974 RepID=A0A8J8NNJ9_HALGN|nr:hypothetical protein FGO68_gene6348 [Halteria grandinella]
MSRCLNSTIKEAMELSLSSRPYSAILRFIVFLSVFISHYFLAHFVEFDALFVYILENVPSLLTTRFSVEQAGWDIDLDPDKIQLADRLCL